MFIDLFNIIKNNFTTPLVNDLLDSNFFNNIIIFLNKILNSFFDMFHDAPTSSNIEFINNELIAEVLGVVVLVIFIYIIYLLFKFVFDTLKTIVVEIKKEFTLNAYLEKKGGKKKIKL